MTRRRLGIAAMVVLVLGAAWGWGQAGSDKVLSTEEWHRQRKREMLRGLRGTQVVVEDIRPDAEKDGLRRLDIQTDVELQLRKAGIRVLTKQESLQTPGMPCLRVSVDTLKVSDDLSLYAYMIDVGLHEQVMLIRDPARTPFTETWSTPIMFGTVGASRLQDLRGAAIDEVKVFINDYLAANPPNGPVKPLPPATQPAAK